MSDCFLNNSVINIKPSNFFGVELEAVISHESVFALF